MSKQCPQFGFAASSGKPTFYGNPPDDHGGAGRASPAGRRAPPWHESRHSLASLTPGPVNANCDGADAGKGGGVAVAMHEGCDATSGNGSLARSIQGSLRRPISRIPMSFVHRDPESILAPRGRHGSLVEHKHRRASLPGAQAIEQRVFRRPALSAAGCTRHPTRRARRPGRPRCAPRGTPRGRRLDPRRRRRVARQPKRSVATCSSTIVRPDTSGARATKTELWPSPDLTTRKTSSVGGSTSNVSALWGPYIPQERLHDSMWRLAKGVQDLDNTFGGDLHPPSVGHPSRREKCGRRRPRRRHLGHVACLPCLGFVTLARPRRAIGRGRSLKWVVGRS